VNRSHFSSAQNNEQISRSQFGSPSSHAGRGREGVLGSEFRDHEFEDQRGLPSSWPKTFWSKTQVKVRVGTLPPIEVTQARAGVADREEGVIVAQNTIRTAEDSIRRLINPPSDFTPLEPADPAVDAPQVLDKLVNMDEAVKTAMEHRPDLEQARLDLAQQGRGTSTIGRTKGFTGWTWWRSTGRWGWRGTRSDADRPGDRPPRHRPVTGQPVIVQQPRTQCPVIPSVTWPARAKHLEHGSSCWGFHSGTVPRTSGLLWSPICRRPVHG